MHSSARPLILVKYNVVTTNWLQLHYNMLVGCSIFLCNQWWKCIIIINNHTFLKAQKKLSDKTNQVRKANLKLSILHRVNCVRTPQRGFISPKDTQVASYFVPVRQNIVRRQKRWKKWELHTLHTFKHTSWHISHSSHSNSAAARCANMFLKQINLILPSTVQEELLLCEWIEMLHTAYVHDILQHLSSPIHSVSTDKVEHKCHFPAKIYVTLFITFMEWYLNYTRKTL